MSLAIGRMYAETLLEKLDVREPPDFLKVAAQIGLSIEEADVESFDGALVRPVGGRVGIIVVRRSIRENGRKNFTIAHEIGHFVLPGHDSEESICLSSEVESWPDNLEKGELDANEFAAELLVPGRLVSSKISASQPSLAVVKAIAHDFSASLTASARRFVEFTPHRCAAVMSTRKKIVWYVKSGEFGHHVKVGEIVDKRTGAYECFTGLSREPGLASIPADSWLPDYNLLPGAQILEDSVLLPFYDSVVSLLWIRDRIERRSEWDDEQEEPMDPNEFTLGRKRWPVK